MFCLSSSCIWSKFIQGSNYPYNKFLGVSILKGWGFSYFAKVTFTEINIEPVKSITVDLQKSVKMKIDTHSSPNHQFLITSDYWQLPSIIADWNCHLIYRISWTGYTGGVRANGKSRSLNNSRSSDHGWQKFAFVW